MSRHAAPKPKRARGNGTPEKTKQSSTNNGGTSKRARNEKGSKFLSIDLSEEIYEAVNNRGDDEDYFEDEEGNTYISGPKEDIQVKTDAWKWELTPPFLIPILKDPNVLDNIGFAYDNSGNVFAWAFFMDKNKVRRAIFCTEFDKRSTSKLEEHFTSKLEKCPFSSNDILYDESWTYQNMINDGSKEIWDRATKIPVAPTSVLDEYLGSYREKLTNVYDIGIQVAAACLDKPLEEGTGGDKKEFMDSFSPEELRRMEWFAKLVVAFTRHVE